MELIAFLSLIFERYTPSMSTIWQTLELLITKGLPTTVLLTLGLLGAGLLLGFPIAFVQVYGSAGSAKDMSNSFVAFQRSFLFLSCIVGWLARSISFSLRLLPRSLRWASALRPINLRFFAVLFSRLIKVK